MENHSFFEYDNKSIYFMEYLPEHMGKETVGIVLSKPIWGERIRTHRIFTTLGRELIKKGYYVITFDFFGDGNSSGESQDLSFDSMIKDFSNIYSFTKDKYGFNIINIIGYRMGASILSEALNNEKLKKVILIDPIINPGIFLENALRANLTSQMTRFKKIIKNREVLKNEILDDKLINVDGFLINKNMWDSFWQNSPLYLNKDFDKETVIISTDPKGRMNTEFQDFVNGFINKRVEHIKKEIILTSWKYYTQHPPQLFEKLFSELI